METRQQKNIAKLEECKAFVDSTGTKGANLEDKFLFLFFCGFQYYLDVEKGHKPPCVFESGWGG